MATESMSSHPTNAPQSAPVRSAITRNPFARGAGRLDGRSAAGKRCRDLYQGYVVRLGRPSDATVLADVLQLAELTVAAETARLALLRGEIEAGDQVVRIANLARRIEKKLGVSGPQKPRAPTVADYLAQREATAQAAPSGQAVAEQPVAETRASALAND